MRLHAATSSYTAKLVEIKKGAKFAPAQLLLFDEWSSKEKRKRGSQFTRKPSTLRFVRHSKSSWYPASKAHFARNPLGEFGEIEIRATSLFSTASNALVFES